MNVAQGEKSTTPLSYASTLRYCLRRILSRHVTNESVARSFVDRSSLPGNDDIRRLKFRRVRATPKGRSVAARYPLLLRHDDTNKAQSRVREIDK